MNLALNQANSQHLYTLFSNKKQHFFIDPDENTVNGEPLIHTYSEDACIHNKKSQEIKEPKYKPIEKPSIVISYNIKFSLNYCICIWLDFKKKRKKKIE